MGSSWSPCGARWCVAAATAAVGARLLANTTYTAPPHPGACAPAASQHAAVEVQCMSLELRVGAEAAIAAAAAASRPLLSARVKGLVAAASARAFDTEVRPAARAHAPAAAHHTPCTAPPPRRVGAVRPGRGGGGRSACH